MSNGEVHVTTRKPSPPPDADFAIFVDFKKGEGDPHRVFKVADGLISSFHKLDRVLCNSIDVNIETLMVLEDIEAGSLKIWLKNLLSTTDDQALKELNWKPAVGKYLVRAKYIYINWSNKTGIDASLLSLVSDLKKIAQETDVKFLPDYAPPSTQELATITKEVDLIKGNLIDGDSLKYISPDEEPLDFDLSIHWSDIELEDMVVKEVTATENMSMNLIVKKPDYLGRSKWEFRLGNKPIFASINHAEWLDDFHNRNHDIRPGDALKCKVTVEHSYGYDNELIKETYTITHVDKILVNQAWKQVRLIDDTDK